MRTRMLLLMMLVSVGGTAAAQDNSVGLRAGLLGVGVEYTRRFTERLAFRVTSNGSSYSFDSTESGIDYDLSLDFDSTMVGFDVHPKKGPFRLSVGVMQNDNGLSASSRPTTQPIDVGGTFYDPSQLGTLRAGVGFEKDTAPFIGMGWDWLRKRKIGFSFDLGVVSQGTPRVSLSADGPVASDPVFQNNLQIEQGQLQDSLNDFDTYPFANFGVVVRF